VAVFDDRKMMEEEEQEGPFIFGEDKDEDSTELSDELEDDLELSDDLDDEFEEPEEQLEEQEYRKPPRRRRPAPRARRARKSETSIDFNSALEIAELKFRFWQYLSVYVVSGILLAVVNLILRAKGGYTIESGYSVDWWVQWPLAVYGIFLLIPFCRAYLFRGRDLRTMIQDKLRRMAERELERAEYYDE